MPKKAAEDKGTSQQVPGIGDDDHRTGLGNMPEECRRLLCILKGGGGLFFVEDFFGGPPERNRQRARDGRFAMGVPGSGTDQPDLGMATGQVQGGFHPTPQSRRGTSIGASRAACHNDGRKRQNRCGTLASPPVQPAGCCDPADRDAHNEKNQTGIFQMAW